MAEDILRGREFRKIIVFLHPNLGDAVWHTVTLRWIREAWPEAKIVALTGALGREVLEACGYADEVWVRRGSKNRVLWPIAKERFDMAYFAYPQNSFMRLAKLAGVKFIAGPRGTKMERVLDVGVEEREGEHAILGFNRRLLEALGVEVSGEQTDVRIGVENGMEADQLLDGVPSRFVAVMAGSSHVHKEWPSDRFDEVVKNLAILGYGAVAVGGPGDEGKVKGPGLSKDLAGKMGVLTTAEVLRRAKAVVTNDTGVMHLAGAVATPVVGIYGALTERTHYPPGQGHRLFSKPCSCPLRSVDTCRRECIDATSVAEVWSAVLEVLGES